MSSMTPDRLNMLKDQLKLLENTVTKQEFISAFKELIKFAQTIQNNNAQEFSILRSSISMFEAKTKETVDKELSDKQKELMAACMKEMELMIAEHDAKMLEVDDKLDAVQDGKDADEEKIVQDVLARIPQQEEVELDGPDEIRNKLELLQGDERLDKSAIRGLDEWIAKNTETRKSIPGWGAHPLKIESNGTVIDKVARIINFTGATVTRSADGIVTVAFSGGGGYQAPTSGIVDGSNTIFVFATAPSVIIVDGGRAMRKVSSDDSINWTGTTSITLSIAPTFDIFSLK